MFITEEEAKKKWCPQSRVWYSDGRTVSSYNRKSSITVSPYNRKSMIIPSDSGCIGSECMMWVWASPQKELGTCGLINKN